MWTCPKCKREFKRKNQGHYCGKAPECVDEYIELQIPEARKHMIKLRSIIQSSVAEVTESIAWSMAVYKKDKHSVSFAACKKHVSFYIDSDILEIFKSQLSDFVIMKNAIYFPYDKELPVKTIENIVKQSFKTR